MQSRQSNPFSTRWVRPGAVPYLFSTGVDAAAVVARLQAAGWRGAIVGPHGSGKSTLLASLIPLIKEQNVAVQLIALHNGQRKLPPGALAASHQSTRRRLLVIDGYEQLSWWQRQRLAAACRRHRWGLLITAHAAPTDRSLPVLFRTAADLATVQFLIDDVLPSHGGQIGHAEVAAAFQAAAGNVRETLFALYDLYEQRRRAPQEGSPQEELVHLGAG
ncbi:MAG TPA: hypothetical protein VFE46_06045 [Pirellulales bacterium]|jgi:hypothetical protein|nr:hypothetical protein [Pirellulales bacterium]